MSKSMNMLRTRRRDNNVKPNRRLDRKSSRGMIYENEELRLKTININAEIERGQNDIKKLRRENEMLKKEIWCLRDEYEKLDKLLKTKEGDFSSSSCSDSSDTESCTSCTEESEEVETSQNLQNFQKTNSNQQQQQQQHNKKQLHVEFDHLSIVQEENSTENSDKNSQSSPNRLSLTSPTNDVIKPDQEYPMPPKHFFAPLAYKTQLPIESTIHAMSNQEQGIMYHKNPTVIKQNQPTINHNQPMINHNQPMINHNQPMINQHLLSNQYLNESISTNQLIEPPDAFTHTFHNNQTLGKTSSDIIVKMDNQNFIENRSSFCNGGNLEDLLNDIETISQDILKITKADDELRDEIGFKSELSVVLMPQPMPLLGFEKYEQLKVNNYKFDDFHDLETTNQLTNECDQQFASTKTASCEVIATPSILQPPKVYNQPNDELCSSRSNLIEVTSSDQISSENEEKKGKAKSDQQSQQQQQPPRKVSIHFKGKKNKNELTVEEAGKEKQSSLEAKSSSSENKQRKSVSISPDRSKHGVKHKKHKKIDNKLKHRRNTISSDRFPRDRSFSICTDRSNIIEHVLDDYTTSDRERTNSLSSCAGTPRKMSNISNFPVSGKIPWCGCWGNGCL